MQAARTIPLLAGLEPRSRRTARAIRLLRRWDRVLRVDSGAAALFEVWNSIELPTAVLRAALGSQKAVDAIWPGDPTVILELLEHPDRRLGRHPRRARDRALLTSLERAIDRTEALLGTRWSRWEWGKLHVAHFEHPIAPAVDAALARRLAVGPVPVGGGGETVGDTGYSTDGPPKGVEDTRAYFEVASGASFRQVIDVGAWDRSLVMNNPGQSGDPASPHYRDLIERWAKGRPGAAAVLARARRGRGGAADRLYAAVRLRPGRFCTASGDASQKSSILTASEPSIRVDTAHISTGSSPSLRCERGVRGATRTTDPAATWRMSSPKRIVSVPRVTR